MPTTQIPPASPTPTAPPPKKAGGEELYDASYWESAYRDSFEAPTLLIQLQDDLTRSRRREAFWISVVVHLVVVLLIVYQTPASIVVTVDGVVVVVVVGVVVVGAAVVVGMHNSATREAALPIAVQSKTLYLYAPVFEGGACNAYLFTNGEVPSQQLARTIP